MSLPKTFRITCGQCLTQAKKKREELAYETGFRIPMLIAVTFDGDTLEEAYGKFVAHVQEIHPEMSGEDYAWESQEITYYPRNLP